MGAQIDGFFNATDLGPEVMNAMRDLVNVMYPPQQPEDVAGSDGDYSHGMFFYATCHQDCLPPLSPYSSAVAILICRQHVQPGGR